MKKTGFTVVEAVVVCLIVGLVIATVMRLLSGTFSGAQKGFDTLNLIQENSKLLAAMKQDLRTIIIGGPDNIQPPGLNPLVPGAGNNTQNFEFFKVWNIHESGRPLSVKVTYSRAPSSPGNPFGLIRTTGTGAGPGSEPERKFVKDLLTGFKIEFLNNRGVVISNNNQVKEIRKVRVSLESKGTEMLSTMVSIYSPYILATGSLSIDDLWKRNFTCVDFLPGASVRICGGGTIQGTPMTALGTPLVLEGETPIVR